MKKLILVLTAILCAVLAEAESGNALWLRAELNDVLAEVEVSETSPTIQIAQRELKFFWKGGRVLLEKSPMFIGNEGFSVIRQDNMTVIKSKTDIGLLYGAYALLRRQVSDGGADAVPSFSEHPVYDLRLLDHWDNLDGSVQCGYAGKSIWKWDEIGADGEMSRDMKSVLQQYARANASVGINGVVLNNVSASPQMLADSYLQKVKTLADGLRPYGIRVFLSVNLASPVDLGATQTADPLDEDMRAWWTDKVNGIYDLIADFGGFLVDAHAGGQPRLRDYGRSHADGANMLAEGLQPHGGIVMWRTSVNESDSLGEDRAMLAVSEYKPLDGQFAPNVILQSKNGPLDFQPREPYAPIFDQVRNTPQMVEFQITQEYTGQSKHLVFLAPLWKDFFSCVSPNRLRGMAGVANIGDDENWCGHPFSQANWYAFGRLAWNPKLTSEEIAREWLQQTFAEDEIFLRYIGNVMLSSYETYVDYTMPYGLHGIANADTHYGPAFVGSEEGLPQDSCLVLNHKADEKGVGFDRTMATGTGATVQYAEPYSTMFEDLATCPDEYLLWFHHVPWDYLMKDGLNFWVHFCGRYTRGVEKVQDYRKKWQGIKDYVDPDRWEAVDKLLAGQLEAAMEWRYAALKYFQDFSKIPVP